MPIFRKLLTLFVCFTVLVMFSLAYAGDKKDCAAATQACPKTCPHMKKAESTTAEAEKVEATAQTAESVEKKHDSKVCVTKTDPGCATTAKTADVHKAATHEHASHEHASKEDCTHGVQTNCIQAYHEAMAPACHEYIPQGVLKQARADVAVMVKTAGEIAEYNPGCTYGSKLTKQFIQKRDYFVKSVAELEKASENGSDEEFKKAFDKMHSAYAEMNGTLYLRPEGVEEFHNVLAVIWHEYLSAKNFDQIKASSPELVQKAEALTKVQLDERMADCHEHFQKAASAVYKCAQELAMACEKDDPEVISGKVEQLHNSYNELTSAY